MTEREYLQPLRDEMARVEAEIGEHEKTLVELRKTRTSLGHALRGLDPQWAANHKPKRRKGGGHSYGVSEERLEAFLEVARERFDGQTLTVTGMSEALGLHETTVSKLAKILHDSGRLQLDHMGGPRKSQKFYRLPNA